MGTYYNTLYNGNLALENGKEAIRDQYTDNFWNILPVERQRNMIQSQKRANKSGNTTRASARNASKSRESSSRSNSISSGKRGIANKRDGKNSRSGLNSGPQMQQTSDAVPASDNKFDRAEEKATKAIQKHNMLINGTEYNYKMDEAFLLLGKARYYDERYIPALEAFNYVLSKYPKSDLLARAKIWREKTLLKLENYDQALKNLKKLLDETDLGELEDMDYANASAAMAQAYLDLKEPKKAIAPLDTAINYTDIDRKKARYLFIKGQLYDSLQQPEKANQIYDRVIALNRSQPRKYLINAHLKKAQNYDLKMRNPLILEEQLFELAEDRENRPFLDKIYYELAQYYRHREKLPAAVDFYNQSLRTGTQDRELLSRTYLTLGNIKFDDAEYKTAGAYYDSTLTNLKQNTRQFRDIKRKRDNLEDVIKYEDIAARNDSLLHLVRMSPEKRKEYFTAITDSLKAKALVQADKEKNAVRNSAAGGNLFGRKKSSAGSKSSSGKFYFYDDTQRKSGVQSFANRWGKRALQDDWRYVTGGGKASGMATQEEGEISIEEQIQNDPKYQPSTYIEQIPSEPEVIDSISDERNFAYYQLGIIYKEQFEEYELAIAKLTGLLNNEPEERLIVPSKYYLYKIYETTGNTAKQDEWKQNILNNHADSRYASIIKNPRSLKDAKNSPQKIYAGIYQNYKKGNLKTVIEEADEKITRFTGDNIVPKLELLKAMAKGRLHGYNTYKESLNYVALTYPQSPEGKKAEKMIKETLPAIADSGFTKNGKVFKLVYPFSSAEVKAAEELKKKLDKAIAAKGFGSLSTSIDVYSPQKVFVVVHGLDSKLGAEGFGERLKENKNYRIGHKNMGISSKNYSKVLIHKNWDKYQQQHSE